MKLNKANREWEKGFSLESSDFNFSQISDAFTMVQGNDFFVVCKYGGWTEVYDLQHNLISTEVFLNVEEIKAEEYITIKLKNGWSETYDRWFNMQSIKYLGHRN